MENGWDVRVWLVGGIYGLVGAAVRRIYYFVSALFCSSIPTFCSFKKMLFYLLYSIIITIIHFKKAWVGYKNSQLVCSNIYLMQ